MAEKSMPDPKVGKNEGEGDREAELPCKYCGSKEHKSMDCKSKKKYEDKKKDLAKKHK